MILVALIVYHRYSEEYHAKMVLSVIDYLRRMNGGKLYGCKIEKEKEFLPGESGEKRVRTGTGEKG
jgi:hypothetical protein